MRENPSKSRLKMMEKESRLRISEIYLSGFIERTLLEIHFRVAAESD